MRRIEFMRELSYLLQDMDEADREEALRYYNDYFEDAGPDKEEEVAKELGSPEKVAAILKDGMRAASADNGSFTDQGYTDERFEESRMPETYRKEKKDRGREEADGRAGEREGKNPYAYTSEPPKKQKKNSALKILLIVLLCICAVPVLGPVALAAAAVLLMLILAAVIVVFALGISGIAIVVSGIIALGSGIAKVFAAPAAGFLICGASLVVVAVGILVAWFMGWLFFKVMPPILNNLIRMMRGPIDRRRGRNEE